MLDDPDAPPHPFAQLEPGRILDTLEAAGWRGDGRLLALNSYENRVYQVWLEDGGLGRRLGGFGLGTEYCPRSKWGTTRAELSPGPAAPV